MANCRPLTLLLYLELILGLVNSADLSGSLLTTNLTIEVGFELILSFIVLWNYGVNLRSGDLDLDLASISL